MLITSLLADFLDGFVARLLKVSSPIGKELDSLADMVTFGVVPGFIMGRLIQESMGREFIPNVIWHPLTPEKPPLFLFGFIIIILSAVRLARFNLDTRQSDRFIGVPTPANTIFIYSLWLIQYGYKDFWLAPLLENTWVLIAITLISSYWLIVELPLIALKFKNFSVKDNLFRYGLIAACVLGVAIFRVKAIPFLFLFYLLLSIIEQMVLGKDQEK